MSDSHERQLDEVIERVITEMFPSSESGSEPLVHPEPSAAIESTSRRFRPFVAPKQIGPYPVSAVLGEGGLGVIVRATDPKLDREIAIKVLREEFAADPGIVQQFLAEARVTGSLQHPGVVPIHDVGQTEQGLPYFVMKTVGGQTFAAMLAAREEPTKDRRRFLLVFEKVCETVAFAHSKGLVHRDLKPGNVMVGAFGEAQVLDWGLASECAVTGRNDARASVDSLIEHAPGPRIFGTPAYMAPEQARGEFAAIDARTDVFALGAILTEILTGAPPYLAESSDEIYLKARRAWLDDAFARLDACAADPALVDLARRCLSPEIQLRPIDATAVAREVDRYLAWLDQRANQLKVEAAEARGRARLTMVIGAAIAVLLVGVIAWLWLQSRAYTTVLEALERAKVLANSAREGGPGNPDRWSKAISATEQVVTVSALHAGVREQASRLLEQLRASRDQAAKAQEFLTWLDESRLRLTYGIGSDDMLQEFSAAFHDLGLDPIGADIDRTADLIRRSSIRDNILQALDLYAFDFHAAGRDQAWKELLRVGLRVDEDPWRNAIREAFMADDLERLRQLARSSTTREASAEALDLLARGLRPFDLVEAVRTWRAAVARPPLDVRIVHRFENVLWLCGAPREEILWLNLLAVTLQPESAFAWHKLATALRLTGHAGLAESATERGLHLDPSYRWVEDLDRFRARVVRSQGFLVEAVGQLEDLVALRPSDRGALFDLGRDYYRLQRAEEAVRVYERVLAIRESASQRCNLGLALSLAGRFDAAIDELERGRELGEKIAGWPHDVGKWLEEVGELKRLALAIPASGEPREPADPERRALMASTALLRHRPWTALQLFRSAFAADPQLEQDCGRVAAPYLACFRVFAAEAAVQVAAGTTGQTANLSDQIREQCLADALEWLRGELRALEALASESGSRLRLRKAAARLLYTPLFAPVRPGEGLENLVPADHQGSWRGFWVELERSYRETDPSEGPEVGNEPLPRTGKK